MRKTLFALLSALAGCVSVEPAPDPRGAVKPGQRIIVMVYQSPGPWIVADADSKAETALKIMPLGTLLQTIQEEKINELSKEIQPYLPRPRYAAAVEGALIAALKTAHDGPIQTGIEAGIEPLQRKQWNDATDQLDWRRKYFVTDPGKAPRNYSKLLSLDDAMILDVNLSFGVEPEEETDRSLPVLSASSRLYRADTTRMMWSHEDFLSDKTSSATLTEFRAAPSDLTDRLYNMSIPLGRQIATVLAASVRLLPAPQPVTPMTPPADQPLPPAPAASEAPAPAVPSEPAAAVSSPTATADPAQTNNASSPPVDPATTAPPPEPGIPDTPPPQ
jgi:hypothetical protein